MYLLELLLRGLLHVGELRLELRLHLGHRLPRRAARPRLLAARHLVRVGVRVRVRLRLRVRGLLAARHLLGEGLALRRLPVAPPVRHGRRQRGPRQPRPRRRQHALLPRLLLPHVMPRRPAGDDARVLDPAHRLARQRLHPLLALARLARRRLLLRRARQLDTLLLERLLLLRLRQLGLARLLLLQMLQLGLELLDGLLRVKVRVRVRVRVRLGLGLGLAS